MGIFHRISPKLSAVLGITLTLLFLNVLIFNPYSEQNRYLEHGYEIEMSPGLPLDAIGQHGFDEFSHVGEDGVSMDLKDKVRVLCWVMTGPANHQTKAKAVKETWGSRCNILLFMSSEDDPSIPTVMLSTTRIIRIM